MEERDDFGEDEVVQAEYYTTPEAHPNNKRRLFCDRQGCNDRLALQLDRVQGHYVCTQCGTIANVQNQFYQLSRLLIFCLVQTTVVFEDETFDEGKGDEVKRQTFLKINGLSAHSETSVPRQLHGAHKRATVRYRAPLREKRKKQIHSIVNQLLFCLELPSAYETHAVGMTLDVIHILEQKRRRELDTKMDTLAHTTFDEAVAKAKTTERAHCVDCKRVQGIGELKRRAICQCYQCEDCSVNEWYEDVHVAKTDSKKDEEAKAHFVHRCRAPATSEMEFNRRKRRRIARNESRTLVNAFTSIATACIYLCARIQQRRFRWKELTGAVQDAFGREMRRDTVTRWVARISSSLKLEKGTVYDTVFGFANHYLDKLRPTTDTERTFAASLIKAVMRQKHPCSEYATASLRAVIGRVYNRILDGGLPKTQMQKRQPKHLHNQQPWVLAAVCVYLVLQIERQGEFRPTIAYLCELLKVDQSSFQKCKLNIARFI